ncbi:hypothetical protein BZA77DRAFT_352124 [Pyronema omphalodes]|nr:hypothetical protein BZA77DRAFT_359386 [Pyronema omphalodes]KAI5817942.1 hypothetical protein BZA77DRAFT_352124 [Pyronema omphalodes]
MSKLRKKDKYGAASTTAQPDTDMREQESQEKTAHPAIVPTEIGIAPSITKGKSGVSFHEQHTFQGQGTNPTPPQAKREKRKTKEEGKPKTSSTPPACLSTCPTEVLQSIIGFLRGTKAAHRLDDLLNLRHVNRRFRYLLQPILYESVRIPGQYTSGRSVSKDVRKLLRLIDVNPSLATSIKDVTYYEFPPLEVQEVQYSMKKLKHDFRILSKFVEETGLKDLTGNTLEYILHPSRLHEMSILYENMCIPLLLSRLTNLRILKFGGHVGGGYAFLDAMGEEHMAIHATQISGGVALANMGC